MHTTVTKQQGSAVLMTALMTLPLLMPGARRRYGTIPVALAVIGLAGQMFSWARARRRGAYELTAAMQDPDIARSPHLRSHLE